MPIPAAIGLVLILLLAVLLVLRRVSPSRHSGTAQNQHMRDTHFGGSEHTGGD